MKTETENKQDDAQNGGEVRDCPDSAGSMWRSDMPSRQGLYLLKCKQTNDQEVEISIYEKDGELRAKSEFFMLDVLLVLLHGDVEDPWWRHLISVS